jgi:putative redox protein
VPSEAHIHAIHQGDWRISADDGVHSLLMDYPDPVAPGGELAGLTPLKTLLASLAGCSGNSVAALLRKMRQPVSGVEVEAHALRRDEHPTVYTDIDLAFTVHGSGVDREAVEKAIRISEEQVCPVWAMLKGGVTITSSLRLLDD